jgi:magnesium-transporting ATPase (P-type)
MPVGDHRDAGGQCVSVPPSLHVQLQPRLPENRLIWFGIIFELLLLLLIAYTPWGNALFGTAPLGVEVWLFIIAFMPAMLLAEELRKAVVRRMAHI